MNIYTKPQQESTTPTPLPISSILLQRACACGQHGESGSECTDCKKKHQGMLQRAGVYDTPTDVPPIVHEVLNTSGQPLDSKTKTLMESRFGHDFSRVRVHTDAQAAESAYEMNSRAYTVGHNVVFGAGHYAPETNEGRRLVAHELTHVVQQQNVELRSNVPVDRPDSLHEQEANQFAQTILYQEEPEVGKKTLEVSKLQNASVQRDSHDVVGTEEFDLAQQRSDYLRLVDRWFNRYEDNLVTNSQNARNANERFIDFEEDGIDQLGTVGGLVGTGVSAFGGLAMLVGVCIEVLSAVAAENLSGKSAKTAAASRRLDDRLADARTTIQAWRDDLDTRIDNMASAYDHTGWWEITNLIANYGVPDIVEENIIYRELLLQLARGGGYNISGSQWNVDNMSIFGDAPWYHSWDWGSPGWTNGRDIADELNAIADADPSTRIRVSINPP